MSHSEKTVILDSETQGETPADPRGTTPEATVNGRFRTLRTLGAGGIGSVHLVEDTLHGNRRVALKQLQAAAVDRKRIRTLQNEFLVLSLLRHPGVARVYDFGRDLKSSGLFFTSEFVDGVTLIDACRKLRFSQPAHQQIFVDLFAQILRALEFIHSRNLVHGDLKPANILVTADDMSGAPETWRGVETKLIDFGLVRAENDFGGRNVMGTLQYIAPEVISGSQIDRRTDLYSIGSVAYCLLTGKFPFHGSSDLATLKAHLEKTPKDPHALVPELPKKLSDIIMRLLNKVPSERFQSAAEVIEELDAVATVELPLETPRTAASYIRYPRVDAHDKYVNALCKAAIATWKVKPSTEEATDVEVSHFSRERIQALSSIDASTHSLSRRVFVHGEVGAGKEVLITSFKGLIQTRGGAFLRTTGTGALDAQGTRRRSDDFFFLLREIVAVEQAVSSASHALSVAESFLTSEVVGACNTSTMEFQLALRKFVRYLLFLSLDQPMVIHVDSAEFASEALADFLRAVIEIQQANEVPQNQLMLSASVCDDELLPESPLTRLLGRPEMQKAISHIHLERLDLRGVRQILEFMFPGHDFPQNFVNRVAASSDGNPKVIGEICSYLLDEDRIVRRTDGWSLIAEAQKDWLPGQVRSGLRSTILALPPDALRLAIAYAYLGSGSELQLAAKFARIDTKNLFQISTTLMSEKILRLVHGSESPRFEFQYKSAQDILHDLVPPEERPGFHERAGRLTEIEVADAEKTNPVGLARHFIKARKLREALRYGTLAANAYEREFRLDLALEVLLEVAELARRLSESIPTRQCYRLAKLFRLCGKFQKARKILLSIHGELERNNATELLAQTYTDLAEIDGALGDLERCEEWAQRAISITEDPDTKAENEQRARAILVTARLRILQGRYGESAELCGESIRISKRCEAREPLARALLLLAENHFARGERSAAVAACLKALRLFDRSKDAASREEALYCLGKLYKFQDRFSQARMEFLFCAELRGQMGAADAEAEALVELGGLDLFLGKVQEAALAFQRAKEIYESTGNRLSLLKTLNLHAESLRMTGNLDEADAVVEQAIAVAKELKNPLGASEALLVLGKAELDAGKLSRAEELLRTAYPTPPVEPRARLKYLEFNCRLFHNRGDFGRLLEHAEQGVAIAREIGLPVHEAQFLEHKSMVQLRLHNLKQAKADAAALSEAARKYKLPLSMGRALLVEALVAAEEGTRGVASHYFNRSRKIFLEASSERDLVRHYAHYGQFLISDEEYAEAFWLFEEGLYLAKKLKLDYWRCQYFYLCGMLTQLAPDGSSKEAKGLFMRAERMANRAPYGDLLWNTRKSLAKLAQ